MSKLDFARYLGFAAFTAFAAINTSTLLMGFAGGRENVETYVSQHANPVEKLYMDMGKPGREIGYVLRDIAKR